MICHSKDGFETKPLFSSGVLIKCLRAFTSATDCQHVRQGKAIFIEVDNELCFGDGKTNSWWIVTSKVSGVVRILEELIEKPKGIVIELVGDPKSDDEKNASQPKELPTSW